MADFETMPIGTKSLLERYVSVFRGYESIHRDKETPEGNLKADVNARLAEEGEHLLSKVTF